MRLYIQMNGRAFGPYELDFVRNKISEGAVRPNTLVSFDRAKWVSASDVPELYQGTATLDPDVKEWYLFDINNFQQGPFTAREIAAFYAQGTVATDTIVRQEGKQAIKIGNYPPLLDLLGKLMTGQADSSNECATGSETPRERAEWFVSPNSLRTYGPFSYGALLEAYRAGQFDAEATVWRADEPRQKLQDVLNRGFDSFSYQTPVPNSEAFPLGSAGMPLEDVAFTQEDLTRANRALTRNSVLTLFFSSIATLLYLVFYVGLILSIANGELEDSYVVCSLVSLALFLVGLIFGILFVRDFWRSIPRTYARLTPDKAWFLLVPIWNLYWIFPTFSGGALDINRAIHDYTMSVGKPIRVRTVSAGLAGSLCVVAVMFAFIAIPWPTLFFANPILISQMRYAAAQANNYRAEACSRNAEL